MKLTWAALISALMLFAFASPAPAAPQGPWVLPATDTSAAGQSADLPQIAIAPDGAATAVWRRFNGIDNIVQAATRPPGGSFGAAVDLSAAGQNAFSSQIAIAPDGSATAIWSRLNGANPIAQASTRPPGGSFGAAVDLSATGQGADQPQIAIAPDGTATVVWYRFNGTNFIIQAATRPPGGSFGAAVDLSTTGQNAFNPQIAIAPDGTATAVWYRFNGTNDIIQAATRPPGGAFGAAVDLSAAGQNAVEPQIAFAPDGAATAVWRRNNGIDNIIQAATRPPGGSFGATVNLSAAGQNAFSSQIAIAPDGSATAIWTRLNGANFVVQAATRSPGGAFGAAVDLSAAGQNAFQPQIAFAPDGSASAIWSRLNGANFIVQAATRPPGGSFGAAVNLSAAGQDASSPQIVVAPDGAATAVWNRYDGSNVLVQTASTAQPSILLQVERAGSGTGTVTSSPAGISCGADCAESYLSFTNVVLTATPSPGSTFTGWSGAGCSGTGTCEVTLLDAAMVTATFATIPKAKVNKVKVSGPTKVKKGKKATYKVKITNSGNAAATGVKLQIKGKGTKAKKTVGKIAAGKSKTVKVKLKFKKPGKVKLTFKVTSSNAGSKTVKKKITVRK